MLSSSSSDPSDFHQNLRHLEDWIEARVDSDRDLLRLAVAAAAVVVDRGYVTPQRTQVGLRQRWGEERDGEEKGHLVQERVLEDGREIADCLVVLAQLVGRQRAVQSWKGSSQGDFASWILPLLKN